MTEFLWPVRVYYEDTDAGGVVFYANYLKYMERSRTEYLRQLGFEQDALMQQNLMFAVHRAEIDYLKPARFNELLQVSARVKLRKRASLLFDQEVCRDNGEVCSRGLIKIVCVDSLTFKPHPIPEEILRKIPDEH